MEEIWLCRKAPKVAATENVRPRTRAAIREREVREAAEWEEKCKMEKDEQELIALVEEWEQECEEEKEEKKREEKRKKKWEEANAAETSVQRWGRWSSLDKGAEISKAPPADSTIVLPSDDVTIVEPHRFVISDDRDEPDDERIPVASHVPWPQPREHQRSQDEDKEFERACAESLETGLTDAERRQAKRGLADRAQEAGLRLAEFSNMLRAPEAAKNPTEAIAALVQAHAALTSLRDDVLQAALLWGNDFCAEFLTKPPAAAASGTSTTKPDGDVCLLCQGNEFKLVAGCTMAGKRPEVCESCYNAHASYVWPCHHCQQRHAYQKM